MVGTEIRRESKFIAAVGVFSVFYANAWTMIVASVRTRNEFLVVNVGTISYSAGSLIAAREVCEKRFSATMQSQVRRQEVQLRPTCFHLSRKRIRELLVGEQALRTRLVTFLG